MRTQMMIGLIVGAVLVAGVGAVAGLIWWLGWPLGLGTAIGAVTVTVALYGWVIRPWHLSWGATLEETARGMPGDELVPGAEPATRAVSIAAPSARVWPWLVQIGFGRAGWYSYDWIDNDFRPSADRIIEKYQVLEPGDTILMTPDMGFEVVSVDPPHSIVSLLSDSSTSWCLSLFPDGNRGTRLVSRWRPSPPTTLAAKAMLALVEPGAFIMEQKMLRTIRRRAEAAQ